MTPDSKQSSDSANGQPAAGTKELSKGGDVAVSSKIEDGGASGKGYKVPELKSGTR